MTDASVVFYISGHGFGHAVRQIAIIRALLAATAGRVRVVVRTGAPAWLFARTLPAGYSLLAGDTDTGAVQRDGLHLDERATVREATAFYSTLPDRVAAEAAILRSHRAALVVADAPPLACAAAAVAGVPAAVCSNFTWDWIYEAYVGGDESGASLLAAIGQAYSTAAGWRLPMHGGFATVGPITDVPLVARHARRDRSVAELRRALSLPADIPLALVSFGGYGAKDLPLDRLDCAAGWRIVLTDPGARPGAPAAGIQVVSEQLIYECGLQYEDLVRAVDVVVTKPGYGIVSDCAANDTAVLYTSRGRFAEYDVLVREMPRWVRAAFLPQRDLLDGRWRTALDALRAKPLPSATPATDGAEVVAGLITRELGLT